MGAQSKIGGYVADEADQLEQALRAAGLDPDGVRSWPYWNQFVDRGLRAALAAIHKRGTAPMNSFQGIEAARARQLAATDPSTRTAIAAAERLLGRNRTTAEIQADTAALEQRMRESAEQTRALLGRTTTTTRSAIPPRAPLALDVVEKLAAERAAREGIDIPAAYNKVLAEQPELYDRYQAEQAAGLNPPPAPAIQPAPKLAPALEKIERLAAERAAREGIDIPAAYNKVLAEQPELYTAYVNEVTP